MIGPLSHNCVPDSIRPLIGYRDWRYDATGLHSPHTKHPWPKAVVEARCLKRPEDDRHSYILQTPHTSPHPDCRCGIYAYHDPDDCQADIFFGWDALQYVSGMVQMWGHVEVHSIGMRAQYARLAALVINEDVLGAAIHPPLSHEQQQIDALIDFRKRQVRDLAAPYGVPVYITEELPAVVAEYGDPISSSWLPTLP